MPKTRILAWAQGIYYGVTGVWPWLHVRSFLAVTGPKIDVWLVQTVGALLTVTALALVRAARRGIVSSDLALVAVGEALVLAGIDVGFVSIGRISPIYLADMVPELVLVALWIVWWPGKDHTFSTDSAAQRR